MTVTSRYLIYGLIDPRTGELRYVGKSTIGIKRARQHAFVSPEALSEAEQFWIAYFRFVGCRLVNATNGGEGVLGRIPTAEHRRKAALGRLGKRHSLESRRKIALAHRRRPVMDENGVVYESTRAAARQLNLPAGNISRAARRGQRVRGRTFVFVE